MPLPSPASSARFKRWPRVDLRDLALCLRLVALAAIAAQVAQVEPPPMACPITPGDPKWLDSEDD